MISFVRILSKKYLLAGGFKVNGGEKILAVLSSGYSCRLDFVVWLSVTVIILLAGVVLLIPDFLSNYIYPYCTGLSWSGLILSGSLLVLCLIYTAYRKLLTGSISGRHWYLTNCRLIVHAGGFKKFNVVDYGLIEYSAVYDVCNDCGSIVLKIKTHTGTDLFEKIEKINACHQAIMLIRFLRKKYRKTVNDKKDETAVSQRTD